MTKYNDYTVTIRLKSPLITSFQSDTIFGHICWAIRFLYRDGEKRLCEFLETYDKEEIPPLIVSNGFPSGYLPKPVVPPITQKDLEVLFKRENRLENSFKIKTIKKLPLILKSDFDALQLEVEMTSFKLFARMSESYETMVKELAKEQGMVVQHNTVNRIEGKVTKGLYSQEETFYSPDAGLLVIYLKTNYFSKKELEQIFTYIKEAGFGRDKSTGKGYFGFDIKDGIDLLEHKSPNAFVTLSSYIPKENDPAKGYYHTLLKYGKLGGLYAKGIPEVNGNPFKKPLIMFTAGSVFYDKDYRQGKNYGSLLKKVHQNENIRHYAYAFPVGINLEDTDEDVKITV